MLRQPTETAGRPPRGAHRNAFVLFGSIALAATGLRASSAANGDEAAPAAVVADVPAGDAANIGGLRRPAADHDQHVIALIQVLRKPSTLLDDENGSGSDAAWKVFCKTQAALIKSKFVLQAALREQSVANLPLLKAAGDPIDVLQERLDAGFLPDTEILYVRMNCSMSEAKDAAKLVDKVVEAYMGQVVAKHRQEQLAARDLLERSLENLNDEVSRKWEDYMDIARESGRSEGQRGEIVQRLMLNRIDRVDAELMRLEEAQLKAGLQAEESKETPEEAVQLRFFQQRMEQLEKRRNELERLLVNNVERSVELEARERDLKRLQKIADNFAVKLEMMDLEASAPERIRLIQRAASGAD